MTLNERQHSALRALRSAGAAGLALNDGIAAGDAVKMRSSGLVEITRSEPPRAVITGTGASYLRRDAA